MPTTPTDGAVLIEDAVDAIVASCDGSLRGAVKALMLVNEQLELELQQAYAIVAQRKGADSRHAMLH